MCTIQPHKLVVEREGGSGGPACMVGGINYEISINDSTLLSVCYTVIYMVRAGINTV